MGSPEERAQPHDDVRTEAEAHGAVSAPEPSRAVFLSYASQDAEAARKICDALRAAGGRLAGARPVYWHLSARGTERDERRRRPRTDFDRAFTGFRAAPVDADLMNVRDFPTVYH